MLECRAVERQGRLVHFRKVFVWEEEARSNFVRIRMCFAEEGIWEVSSLFSEVRGIRASRSSRKMFTLCAESCIELNALFIWPGYQFIFSFLN